VLERLNHPKRAKADYEHALELDPDLIDVRLRVVEMLLDEKMAADAEPHLDRLVQQAPNDVRVRARLGMCRFLQGKPKEARQLMEAALPEMPNDASLLISLASLDIQEGRPVEAEQRLRLVLAAEPSDLEALFVLAPALQAQKKTAEAAAVLADHERRRVLMGRLNALLRDVADSPTATADNFSEIGSLFLQMDRDSVARYWLDQALERDPTNASAHRALADYYEKKGDRDKADRHRKQVREPAPPGGTVNPAPP
jgi:tetratricopeptide (TPR) repeat protein